MSVILVENLTYSYPNANLPALLNVDITVEEGEFVLLCGPTGAGKTTLCRAFLGLIPHFFGGRMEGEVTVLGTSTRDIEPSKLAADVGMVFQNPEDQLVAMSVEEEIAFGPENLGLPRSEIKERVDEALGLLNITHLRERSPHELSSGQQQKVAIASILAMRPSVLILDEPTSQLDPRSSIDIINFVKELNRNEGITVVLAEHRLESAAPHADKIVVIDKGGIYACGPPREVLDNDRLAEIGVSIPKIVQLAKALREKGVPLKELPLTVDEAVDMLEKIIR